MMEFPPHLSTILLHALQGMDRANASLELAERQRNEQMVRFLRETADHYASIVASAEALVRDAIPRSDKFRED